MRNRKWSRRGVLKTSTALAAGALFAQRRAFQGVMDCKRTMRGFRI
jgi:hypothetical protein